MNKIVETFQYGNEELRLETGQIARQATGAVLASMGETVVLVTVVAAREPSDRDFFRSLLTTKNEPTPPAESPAVFLSARADRLKKRS